MKIIDLRTIVVGNPWKNWVYVKLVTDQGIDGWGECTGGLSAKPEVAHWRSCAAASSAATPPTYTA